MARAVAMVLVAGAAGVLAAAPARPADPVLVGSRWVGTLTQKGDFGLGGPGPPEFRTTLTVTERSGDRFAADLRETTDGLSITYIVTGEVTRAGDGKGYVLAFRSVGAKEQRNTSAVLGVPYTGTVAGRTLSGTWVFRLPGQDTPIEGTFRLELAK